jgi:hypothetical protein
MARIRITDHSDEEAQSDRRAYEEIFFSVFTGEVIKNYPDDKPYPRCLVYFTDAHSKMNLFTVFGLGI